MDFADRMLLWGIAIQVSVLTLKFVIFAPLPN